MTDGEHERAFEMAAKSIHRSVAFTKEEKQRIITYLRERAGFYRNRIWRAQLAKKKRAREQDRRIMCERRREIM